MNELHSMDELEQRFCEWALERDDVEALIIVGSRARVDHPADEWADLDLGVVTTNTRRYSHDPSWLREISPYWVAFHDPEGASWHVLFEGGFDAGVAPISATALRAARVVLRGMQSVPAARGALPGSARRRIDAAEREVAAYVGRGVRTLVDKRGLVTDLLGVLSPLTAPAPTTPTRAEYEAVVSEFWFVAVWNAKHLRRGELWHAKAVGVDGKMKALLLQMLEWHAHATRGSVDTWEGGRFLEEWADPRARRELAGAYAHYDANDLWRATRATMDLFRWVATETAIALGYPYPSEVDDQIATWITRHDPGTEPA